MDESPAGINRHRYRQILRFFAGIVAQLIIIDLLLGRLPGIRGKTRASRPARYRRIAARFRTMAVEMGGVMIKLGQFLSARVDVLPPEITEELRGLQDEAVPVPFEEIRQMLAGELGDINRHFAAFEEEALAAASFGQAHHAWLLPANGSSLLGEPVIVKVQRPGIADVVHTDLSALRVVAGWAMRYKPIRRRADVPALMDEFAQTLWEELDYRAEASNAERLDLMFAADNDVRIPAVYWQHSTDRVLTLEDVGGMKIDDVQGMEDAGISPAIVSERLLDIYFTQIFQEGFFHADPHPGNIFIRPRQTDDEELMADTAPYEIAFVDFGMVGRIQQLMGDNLRRVLLSVVQQDAAALTDVYSDMGFFLPDADLDRIAEAQSAILNRIWGRSLLEMARPDPDEVRELGSEFKDILREFPFQVPQDFVYLGRAMGMISGLTSQLHPEINPWRQLEKFARQLLQDSKTSPLSAEMVLEELGSLLALPAQARRLLQAAERGELQVRTVDPRTGRRLDRLERQMSRVNIGVFLGSVAVCGAILFVNGYTGWGIACWALSGTGWIISQLR